MKKLISIILSVVLLFSILAVEASAALPALPQRNADGEEIEGTIDYKETVLQYLSDENLFISEEAKLANMTLMYEKDGYQLYADEFTGEVATKNMATGQILFSNPYDIASEDAAYSDTTRYELMSQLVVKYVDNGTDKYFYSFEQAAMNGQITLKNIKDGLRVEYTIGREDTKFLVPMLIEKERFDTQIRQVLIEAVMEKHNYTKEEAMTRIDYRKLDAYYQVLKDPNAVTSDRELAEMQAQYPITKKMYKGKLMAVYICGATTNVEKREVEERIKTYCPLYTFEQLDFDHELTEYTVNDRAPALFKMALEYRLDSTGLSVRLPSNGIRFNEAEYQLSDIYILPWMGCGSNTNKGYSFFPDGSGAIFRFEDLNDGKTYQLSAPVYGQDYAYQTITGTHQEIVRYPVYGLVETVKVPIKDEEEEGAEGGETVAPAANDDEVKYDDVDRGYIAIIEEGEAMAKLNLKHYGAQSKYNTVQVLVSPRPKDTYILSDAVSVGSNNSVTVISERKYVGDFKLRYMMLSDAELAKKNNVEKYYSASWLGMATAYRDYLSSPYSTGTQRLPEDQQFTVLDRLTSADVKDDIPLYIETFGAMQTIEKRLSVPVEVTVALTSFKDIQQMYDDLSGENIKNVNFKLTGYYNGGMFSSVPYRLKFEKAVGGKDGFNELIADAKKEGYGVFLDFDFAYVTMADAFDGLSDSRDLIKTIDDRYTTKRYYSATRQSYTTYFEMAISPSRFDHFYDKVTEKYLEYNPIGISLSTLGSDLSSDFDEDEPYNREDNKAFTAKIFEKASNDYGNVMSESANYYTWRYIDHMINMAVDSSRYNMASASVPFLGVVLHGSVQFAGTPMNMEGNIGYSMLKAIENGSGLYFILSYQNTDILKDDFQLSEYYSVRYDIWFKELVERYNTANSVLKDLQTKLIIDHKFLIGERVPDADEAENDKNQAIKDEEEKKKQEEEAARLELINSIRMGRFDAVEDIIETYEKSQKTFETLATAKQTFIDAYNAVVAKGYLESIPVARDAYEKAEAAYQAALKEAGKVITTEEQKLLDELKAASAEARKAWTDLTGTTEMGTYRAAHLAIGNIIKELGGYRDTVNEAMEYVNIAHTELTKEAGKYGEKIVADMVAKYNDSSAKTTEILSLIEAFENEYKTTYYENVLKLDPTQDYYPEVEEDKEEDKEEEEEGYKYTKYTNDNGNIVMVTYGGKNGVDTDPYRTFILNYNYFAVTVVLDNGETITIEPFEFITINH